MDNKRLILLVFLLPLLVACVDKSANLFFQRTDGSTGKPSGGGPTGTATGASLPPITGNLGLTGSGSQLAQSQNFRSYVSTSSVSGEIISSESFRIVSPELSLGQRGNQK